jgi:hypothetical protein
LQLPSVSTWRATPGQAGTDPRDDAQARAAMVTLAGLAADLLALARTMPDGTMPRTARNALFVFQPALDAVANHLIRHYSVDGTADSVVQPPCNYPPAWQAAFMGLAEAVQAAQDWDARQEQASDPLPRAVLATLEGVVPHLQREAAPPPEAANESPVTPEDELQAGKILNQVIHRDRGGGSNPPAVELEVGQSPMSAPDLARRLGLSVNAVDACLRRYRKEDPDCFTENKDRRLDEPKYLYHVARVLPHLKDHFRLTDDRF